MGRRMAPNASTRALIVAAVLAAACRAPSGGPCRLDGLTCEAPSGWREAASLHEPGARFLYINPIQDAAIGMNFPLIEGTFETSAADEAAAKASRQAAVDSYKDDPDFRAGDVVSQTVAGAPAWSYSVEHASSDELPGREAKGRAPVQVRWRELVILIHGPTRNYRLTFGAPVPLFDREKPAFDRLLSSLKFSQ